MATHSFNISTVRILTNQYDISISPSSTVSSPIVLTEGDTVVFTWTSSAGGTPPSQVNLSNFTTGTFTSSANITLYSVGSSSSKVVATGGTMPFDDSCRVSTTGSGFKYWYTRRVSSVDILPDPFDLGPTIVNANPGQQYFSNQVTITGINTTVTASASNGALVSKNNGSYVSSVSVISGDKVRVRMTSSSSYGASKSTTLTVGSGTDTFTVNNMADPGSGQIIYLGITSGNIALSQIGNLFGRPQYVGETVLSNYLKAPGGVRVPAITANAGVPTSFPLKLTDFYGSATSFYVSTYPQNKVVSYDTTAAGGTFYLKWEVNTDWFLGFHPDVSHVAEYMYSYTETGSNTGVSPSSEATWNSWSNLNKSFQLGITVPKYVERRYYGQVTIYARHPLAPTKVVSATINYWFDFYGP